MNNTKHKNSKTLSHVAFHSNYLVVITPLPSKKKKAQKLVSFYAAFKTIADRKFEHIPLTRSESFVFFQSQKSQNFYVLGIKSVSKFSPMVRKIYQQNYFYLAAKVRCDHMQNKHQNKNTELLLSRKRRNKEQKNLTENSALQL